MKTLERIDSSKKTKYIYLTGGTDVEVEDHALT